MMKNLKGDNDKLLASFHPLNDTFIFQLRRLHNLIFKAYNHLLVDSSIPIKSEQLPILMCLFELGALSQQQIADKICRDKSSVMRSVISLKKKGILSVKSDNEDKRKNVLCLSNYGIELAKELISIFLKIESRLFTSLDQENKKNIIDTMKEIVDKLEKTKK